MMLNSIELPSYIFKKKYINFLFFYNNQFLGIEPNNENDLEKAFLDFLIKSQSSIIVNIYNHNMVKNKSLKINLYDYSKIYNDNKGDTLFINGITETPFLHLSGENNNWEIYTNTIFNLAIFAYDASLESHVGELKKTN